MGTLTRREQIQRLARGVNPLDPLETATPPTFVFNANLAGEMLSSTAQTARKFYQAGWVSRGFSGNSYGLPTGPYYGQRFAHNRMAYEYRQFYADAATVPEQAFLLPRLGCNAKQSGSVGSGVPIAETLIRDQALTHAPPNVMLPGTWEKHRHNGAMCRLLLYGQAYLEDDAVLPAVDYLLSNVLTTLSRDQIEIILPARQDGADRAKKYAKLRGIRTRRVVPLQARLREDDCLTAHLMFWYATHAILLYSSDERFSRYHQLDRYGDLQRFFTIAMNHRLKVRWTDIESIRPVL